MSLWIVDGGIGLTPPVVARVDDWQEGNHIDVTGADENGEWLSEPVRYVKELGTCREVEDEDTGFIVCSECGAVHDECYTTYYCWCCGRRIEV